MRRALIAVGVVLVLGLAVAAPAVAEDANGAELYAKKCAMCHGKDGVANKMATGSANFNDPEFQKEFSAEKIAEITKNGVPDTKMMKFEGKLTDAEIQAVAAYIKTLK